MNPEVEKFLAESDSPLGEALALIATVVGLLDIVASLCLTLMWLFSATDPAQTALGIPLPWLIAVLFLLTALPGLIVARRTTRSRTALALTGAFPVGFMVMYGVLLLAFPG